MIHVRLQGQKFQGSRHTALLWSDHCNTAEAFEYTVLYDLWFNIAKDYDVTELLIPWLSFEALPQDMRLRARRLRPSQNPNFYLAAMNIPFRLRVPSTHRNSPLEQIKLFHINSLSFPRSCIFSCCNTPQNVVQAGAGPRLVATLFQNENHGIRRVP